MLSINANVEFSIDNTKQIVTDSVSRLSWQDDGAVKTTQKNCDDAGAYCEDLNMGGYDDWRLPTRLIRSQAYNKLKDFGSMCNRVYYFKRYTEKIRN